jgi:hypothetical protein
MATSALLVGGALAPVDRGFEALSAIGSGNVVEWREGLRGVGLAMEW